MRIKHNDYKEIYYVFGIYWDEGQIYFYCLEPNYKGLNYEGFIIYTVDEISILDHNINYRTIFHIGNMIGIYHWALIEKFLLDGVIDNDPQDTEEFLSIIRSENLVDW